MVLLKSEDELKRGDTAPEFELKSTDNKEYSLEQLRGDKATLIVFMCNHCPYVVPKLTELNRIYNDFKDKGISVIGINPNDSDNYPEDSFERMQGFVKEGRIQFPYLRDKSQEVAKRYGAVCTPDPFLFDESLKLIFHSRIDDIHKQEQVNKHELYEAIKQYLEKGEIEIGENPSMGCSIKWKY